MKSVGVVSFMKCDNPEENQEEILHCLPQIPFFCIKIQSFEVEVIMQGSVADVICIDHEERKVPKYENHKLRERKVKTLTRN